MTKEDRAMQSRAARIGVFLAILAPACGARDELPPLAGEPATVAPHLEDACVPAAPWSRLVGGHEQTTLTDLVAGTDSDAFATGLTFASVDGLDYHGTGFFVTRLDAAGALVYQRFFSPAGAADCDTGGWTWQLHNGCGSFVAPAGGGGAVIAIRFHGQLDVGGHEVSAPGVLAKLDAQGGVVWAVPIAAEDLYLDRPAVDAAGNVILAGDFLGTLEIGGALAGTASKPRSFLLEVGSGGTLRWHRTMPLGNSTEDPSAVAVFADPSGDAILLGETYGAGTGVDFGGGPVAGDVAWVGFYARYDAAGAYVASRIFAASEETPAPGGVAYDPSLGVVVSGGNVEALDGSGERLWTASLPPMASDEGLFGGEPAIDGAGNVAVLYADTVNPQPSEGNGDNALLVASYDRAGHPAALHHVSAWEDADMDQLRDGWIAFDGCGALRVGSVFAGQTDLGQGTLEAPLAYCEGAGMDVPGQASVVARVTP
jgi:hypothetical protein